MKIDITVLTQTPIHLASGKANVNIDSEVVCDTLGLPYFPGKRLRGLLYESAIELVEMCELSGAHFIQRQDVEALFNRGKEDQPILVTPDLRLENYKDLADDLRALQAVYGEIFSSQAVLEAYTSIRQQTKLDEETGLAATGSLRTFRLINDGLTFSGSLDLVDTDKNDVYEAILCLALQNLKAAGGHRNRGFGQLVCSLADTKKQEAILHRVMGV